MNFRRRADGPVVLLGMLLLLTVTPRCAHALPAGRAWSGVEQLGYPRIIHFGANRLEADSTGEPLLIVSVEWDSTSLGDHEDWAVFSWRASGWVAPRFARTTGAGLSPWPVVGESDRYIVWLGRGDGITGIGAMLLASIGDTIAAADTASRNTVESDLEYGAAIGDSRKWIIRSEPRVDQAGTFAIRTIYSDTARIWHPLPELGVDEDHCTIAPLPGDSAMAVYAGESGLAWASTVGTVWTATGVLDTRAFVAAHPRLRIRPSGGLWLMWTTRRWVHVSSYRDGLWSRGDSMVCLHNPGETFDSGWCDASRDTAERPVLVWGDLGSNATFRNVGCIAFPTSVGWTTPEEIPGSGLADFPTVARDVNGDAWVSWSQVGVGGLYYTHTYCSVTAGAPSVSPSGHGRSVEWQLSAPAPGSWWTIERAGPDGDFSSIGRMQADSSANVAFLDSAPLPGVARYRVVRESVDSRYRWYSPAGQFPARSRKSFALEVSPQPFLRNSALTVHSAAAGAMRLSLYDVQGRMVQQRSVQLSGADSESVPLGDLIPGRLMTGMYFVIGTDASGVRSEPGRIVVIR